MVSHEIVAAESTFSWSTLSVTSLIICVCFTRVWVCMTGPAMRRFQRVTLRWPTRLQDTALAIDAIRKIYNCRSLRSPTPLFSVSIHVRFSLP